MAATGLKLGPFNPETDDWTIYSEQLEQGFISARITEAKEKVAHLLSVIGTQTYTLLRNLTFPDLPASKSFPELLSLLTTQFGIPRNDWKEIRNFMEASQTPEESVLEWYARIKKLAINCNFGENLVYMLKVKFVTGMVKGEVFGRIIEEKQSETLEKLSRIAVQKEHLSEGDKTVNFLRGKDSNLARSVRVNSGNGNGRGGGDQWRHLPTTVRTNQRRERPLSPIFRTNTNQHQRQSIDKKERDCSIHRKNENHVSAHIVAHCAWCCLRELLQIFWKKKQHKTNLSSTLAKGGKAVSVLVNWIN